MSKWGGDDMSVEHNDRQYRAPRYTHVQQALPPIDCPRHGRFQPTSILLQECPECVNPYRTREWSQPTRKEP